MKIGDFLTALATLPVKDMDTAAPGTTLIVAPHPDDESLGCGGFIAEATRRGRPPVVVIVSDGTGSHPHSRGWPSGRLMALREEEARDAVSVLGLPVERLHFLRLRDTAVPTAGPAFEAAVRALDTLARDHDCTNVLVPWRHDPHCDHEATWLIGQALKSDRPELSLFFYPVWGLTLPVENVIDDPAPEGWRLDIAAHEATKRAAIDAHRSQRGWIIDDDPAGFVLPQALLDRMLRPFECYIAS